MITIYRDDFGEYTDARKPVELKLPDGEIRDLRQVLVSVIGFWMDYLTERGITVLPERPEYPTRTEPLAREDCSEAGLKMTAKKGLRFRLQTSEAPPQTD